MVTDILLTILNWFISALVYLLPTWSIWPNGVINALNYFAQQVMIFNFILPIDTLFQILSFLINFFVILVTAKIITMFINYIRGSGTIDI